MLLPGAGLRAQTALGGQMRELMVPATSKRLDMQVELDFPVPFALNQGLSEARIAAINSGEARPSPIRRSASFIGPICTCLKPRA